MHVSVVMQICLACRRLALHTPPRDVLQAEVAPPQQACAQLVIGFIYIKTAITQKPLCFVVCGYTKG